MRRPWAFGLVTFLGVWLLEAVSLSLTGSRAPTPQWFLLAVLALGGTGLTNMAQTLGFFWGLSLDVFSLSLFGSQAWLLAVAGFAAGFSSKQLNAHKLVTQEVMAFLGTALFGLGLYQIDLFFRWPEKPRSSGLALLVLFFYNGLLAPAIFRGMQWWTEIWMKWEARHGFAR